MKLTLSRAFLHFRHPLSSTTLTSHPHLFLSNIVFAFFSSVFVKDLQVKRCCIATKGLPLLRNAGRTRCPWPKLRSCFATLLPNSLPNLFLLLSWHPRACLVALDLLLLAWTRFLRISCMHCLSSAADNILYLLLGYFRTRSFIHGVICI